MSQKYDSRLIGNIGNPVLSERRITKKTIFVIEASSYQLDYNKIFTSKYALILNISPDHLERHKNLKNYVNAKFKLLDSQTNKAIALVKENYTAPKKTIFNLPGSSAMPAMIEILETLFESNKIKDHGLTVGKKLGFMLSGGNTDIKNDLSEQNILDLEREVFLELIQIPLTQNRIKYTLDTGKPLFN